MLGNWILRVLMEESSPWLNASRDSALGLGEDFSNAAHSSNGHLQKARGPRIATAVTANCIFQGSQVERGTVATKVRKTKE